VLGGIAGDASTSGERSMKRDMDLIREILFKIEDAPEATGIGWVDVNIEGRSHEQISYHVVLLAEAGLVEAQDLTNSGSGLDKGRSD
jgi:hypothetical protein